MPEGRKVGVMGQRGGKGLLHIPGDSPISEAYEKVGDSRQVLESWAIYPIRGITPIRR